MINISEKEMWNKVYGCWMGKNIGGTLGGPLEGRMKLMDYDFYTQDFGGKPMENDDLDLQLLNLHAVEQYGIYLTSKHLAKEWESHVFFFMDEYALFLSNARRGVASPVSGYFNNEFTHCMGSPIRSEIWAVMAPGNPKLAAYYAYQDATVDHAGGEGVWGEVFFAALESMAFCESDPYKLSEKALEFIPKESETAKAIRDIMKYKSNPEIDWIEARRRLIEDYGTDNFCYAPLNIAFTMLGIFYGEDFSDAILKALNCGYDTDCTAATAGSILGIIYGADSIPEKWTAPIGTSIVTCPQVNGFNIPKDIAELTERSIKLQKVLTAGYENCIDKSVFDIDYDYTTTKFGVPLDCVAQRDLVVSLKYGEGHPAIDRSQTKELYIEIENKMTAPYCGEVGLISEDNLEVKGGGEFKLEPGEKVHFTFSVTGDGKFHHTYPLNIVINRFLGSLLWTTEKIPFALCPTYNWEVSLNGGEKVRIACPEHRIDFDKVFPDTEVGDTVTAQCEMVIFKERFFRYMTHSAHPVKLILDGKTVIESDGEPYLPAYHRVAPDYKETTKAGNHNIKVEITKADNNKPFEVAFQLVDCTEVEAFKRSALHDDLFNQFNS